MSEGWRISANWRLQRARYGTASGGLKGSTCPEGHFIFPPRDVCPQCAAIGYYGLCQTGETPETVEAEQFRVIVLLAEMTVAVENS